MFNFSSHGGTKLRAFWDVTPCCLENADKHVMSDTTITVHTNQWTTNAHQSRTHQNPAQTWHVTNRKTESRIIEYNTRLHTVFWTPDDGRVTPETCRVLLSIKSTNSCISLVTYMIIIWSSDKPTVWLFRVQDHSQHVPLQHWFPHAKLHCNTSHLIILFVFQHLLRYGFMMRIGAVISVSVCGATQIRRI